MLRRKYHHTWNFQVSKKPKRTKIFRLSVELSPIQKFRFNKNTPFFSSTKTDGIAFQGYFHRWSTFGIPENNQSLNLLVTNEY